MLPGRLHEGRGDAVPRGMVASRRHRFDRIAGNRIRLTGRLLQHPQAPRQGGWRVPEPSNSEPKKCPVCGRGDLVTVTFREGGPDVADEPIQTADARQVESFSCGHEVKGPALDRTAAGSKELVVERRTSEETTEPT
jgi:hypothetical protein